MNGCVIPAAHCRVAAEGLVRNARLNVPLIEEASCRVVNPNNRGNPESVGTRFQITKPGAKSRHWSTERDLKPSAGRRFTGAAEKSVNSAIAICATRVSGDDRRPGGCPLQSQTVTGASSDSRVGRQFNEFWGECTGGVARSLDRNSRALSRRRDHAGDVGSRRSSDDAGRRDHESGRRNCTDPGGSQI